MTASVPPIRDDEVLHEVRCPVCGWYMLVPPDAVDVPCGDMRYPGGRDYRPCPGKVTTSVHATLAQRELFGAFKARVAALLKAIEWESNADPHEMGFPCCPSCRGDEPTRCVTDAYGRPLGGHTPDCALAALLREAEA